MTHRFLMTACAFAAASLALGTAQAQAQTAAAAEAAGPASTPSAADADTGTAGQRGLTVNTLDSIFVKGKRISRQSKGATGLAMDVKETPQSISILEQEDMANFGFTGANDALRLATGVNVDQYETNRATFNSRGFEIQSTQVDGLGMTNDWATVVGQQDTYLFERIELIRGANGLLTGVGNSAGTVNYIRKRPKNEDGGEVYATYGQWGQLRGALDYNKVLTNDGAWAGRLVVTHEDKDSYLRALNDKRTNIYGVVEGQIGQNGTLTFGLLLNDSKQQSPMWGSLILRRTDGTQAEFDQSSSTSVDWAHWNNKSENAFVEYTHRLAKGWDAKVTYNYRHGKEDSKIFYAFGALNDDNTGLTGWPYWGNTYTYNRILDANVNGEFTAWGQQHNVTVGLSQSRQKTTTFIWDVPASQMQQPLPAFPYGGDAYAEPDWENRHFDRNGRQKLTRLYAAARLGITDRLKTVVGLNAVELAREGSSTYGSATAAALPTVRESSPYAGLTYEFTPDVLGYISYSDIFQNQDQTDQNKVPLAPMKGKNSEVGVKSEWLNKSLLTTFALFTAKQVGLATEAGQLPDLTTWYMPVDVKSRGFEFEATGRLSRDTRMTLGFTRLKLTGNDGNDIYKWVPRTTVNAILDSRINAVPGLRLGVNGRWQSDVVGPNASQDAYLVADAFASYELNDKATVRLNVNNLFDKKYLRGIAYGAIYGTPRNAAVTLSYKL